MLDIVLDKMKEEEKKEKQVNFAYNFDELNQHTFLNKLSGAVKDIS